jgi:glucosylceramidase
MRRVFVSTLMGVALWSGWAKAQEHSAVTEWLTTPDRASLLSEQDQKIAFHSAAGTTQAALIAVDEAQAFQTVKGFGVAVTGGSAQLMMRMDAADRKALIEELFGTGAKDIGISYIRVSIGSSDMNESVYSYDDMPPGQTDPDLKQFSLKPDEAAVIPVLKEILAVNPAIRILASPWSAPAWMKTNGDVKGGSLKPENYDVYARYLVRYLQEMKERGIPIDAITMQNEPLNPKNTPSMVMTSAEQDEFLKTAFGPLMRKEQVATKILLFDHNCNHPDYAISILADPQASQYASGSGFHLYEGTIGALSTVHDAFPQKDLYFTEQMIVDRPGATELGISGPERRVVIGAMRNWSRNVLLWNLAADPSFGPHTNNGGCPVCEGAITLDGNTVTRNLAYYTIAHASKFIRPGAVRIASSPEIGALANVAFRTKAGGYALIVANTGDQPQSFGIVFHGEEADATLPAGAVATFLW